MSQARLYAKAVFWPTWGWNLLLGRALRVRHWWDEIVPGVWLGARPLARDVPTLVRLGIRSVVNTCEEFPGHTRLYQDCGIRQLHLPTTDFQPPSLESVRAGVAFVEDSLNRGEPVYVHCKAGRARSATIVLCWLVACRELTPDAAQQLILARRPHANRHLTQRAVVREFVSSLGGGQMGDLKANRVR